MLRALLMASTLLTNQTFAGRIVHTNADMKTADGRPRRVATTLDPCNPNQEERNHMLFARRRSIAARGQILTAFSLLRPRPPPWSWRRAFPAPARQPFSYRA